MPTEKFCKDCGNTFYIRDDVIGDSDVCVWCMFKRVLMKKMEKEKEELKCV